MRVSLPGFAVLSLCHCAPAALPTAPPSATRATAVTAERKAAPAATSPKALPELEQELAAERVSGVIALYDTADGALACSNLAACSEAVTPASTFKIPHSMIALEAGAVEGPDTLLPWDGKRYSVDDWNQDLKLRDAFRLSCVPCYQAIARKVGDAGEREWLEKLDYGNRDTSGGVDRFWLWGGLRVSPLQQIDFLRRFDASQLPISERTADIVRDIMTLDVTDRYVLRGKTGAASPPHEAVTAFWFVGWLELDERRVFFATRLDGHAPGVDPLPARRRVTERALRARGLM